MAGRTITINRAPVLTLWATVVAERLGFRRGEALSLGKALAGLNAQSKGRRIGVFKPHEEKTYAVRERDQDERFAIEILGRPVPAQNTPDGIRALLGPRVIEPGGVQKYLEGKFGDDLKPAQAALRTLARAYRPRELAMSAYGLYEQFRPEIPDDVTGWGAPGKLDLARIERLARAPVRQSRTR